MIVRELLDKLNIKEEDVIQIGDNSYSRNELYSLPKNELIFDKEVNRISLRTKDEYTENMNGTFYVSDTTKVIVIEVE